MEVCVCFIVYIYIIQTNTHIHKQINEQGFWAGKKEQHKREKPAGPGDLEKNCFEVLLVKVNVQIGLLSERKGKVEGPRTEKAWEPTVVWCEESGG